MSVEYKLVYREKGKTLTKKFAEVAELRKFIAGNASVTKESVKSIHKKQFQSLPLDAVRELISFSKAESRR